MRAFIFYIFHFVRVFLFFPPSVYNSINISFRIFHAQHKRRNQPAQTFGQLRKQARRAAYRCLDSIRKTKICHRKKSSVCLQWSSIDSWQVVCQVSGYTTEKVESFKVTIGFISCYINLKRLSTNSVAPYAPRIDQLTRAVAVHTMVICCIAR